jgi:8-oxo-dGTP pyrophosphatase MutT (NUDIX family)
MHPSLRAQLEAHRPADAAEARHLDALRALADAGPDALSRSHFDPGHFTASAFVLSPDRSAILLIFHGKLHRWLQPGGHIDPSDPSLLAAAEREAREETGVERGASPWLLDVDVHEIPPNAKRGEPAHRHYDARFAWVADTWDIRAASDAVAARWTPLHAVGPEESDESVLRAVRKLRTQLGA